MTKRLRFMKDVALNLLLIGPWILSASDSLARAGGGGGMTAGGGGAGRFATGSGGHIPRWVLLFPATVILYLAVWYLRRVHKKRATRQLLKDLAMHDRAWDEERLVAFVKDHFARTQEAWCDQALDKLRDLLHPELFREWQTQLNDRASKGVKDVMKNLFIQEVRVFDVKNYRNNADDQFTAFVKAFANDTTYDARGNIVRKRDPGIYEFWTYARARDGWVLRRIDPGNEDGRFITSNVNEE